MWSRTLVTRGYVRGEGEEKTDILISQGYPQTYCKLNEMTGVCIKTRSRGDFPGGPVGKTPSSQCRGPRFDPWSGN